jgi:hypothetical protein
MIFGTGRGALANFFASHESDFKVPYDCYMKAGNTPCDGFYRGARISHAEVSTVQ